jgi:hypothetical protein
MGIWNQTCALSHVPILGGGPVRAVILKRQGDIDMACGFCYPDTLWAPTGLVLKGEHDSYGRIENIDDTTPAARILYDMFPELVRDKDENKYSHNGHKADSIVSHIDSISRNDAEWQYGYCMIAEPIFNTVIAAVHAMKHWRRDAGTIFESIHNAINTSIEEYGKWEKMGMSLLYSGDMYHFFENNDAKNIIMQALLRERDIFQPALEEYCLLHSAMIYGRTLWIPQGGQGSQEDDMTVHRAIATATLAYAEYHEHRWDDEDEDDDD